LTPAGGSQVRWMSAEIGVEAWFLYRCCIICIKRIAGNGLMKLLRIEEREVSRRGWRAVMIVIAICSLTLTVATRFWTPSTSQSHIVKSVDRRSVDPKRQHLLKEAARWVASSASFGFMAPAFIEARVAPPGPLLPKHVFTDSLYNRPPPSSVLFL